MSATSPDTPSGRSAGQRRRRTQLVLVASALVVLAATVGTGLAIATRPIERQPAVAGAAGPGSSAAGQTAVADQQQAAKPPATADATPAKTSTSPAAAAAAGPALEDGDHDAYITEVDAASNRVVVDVVQVFHDGRAVKEAIADGRAPAEAKYLTTWVRNENPRLRTLPLAGDLKVKLRDTCGEGGGDRQAQLTRLAANARQNGTYYYTLTVDDGTVERIQERLAVNAC